MKSQRWIQSQQDIETAQQSWFRYLDDGGDEGAPVGVLALRPLPAAGVCAHVGITAAVRAHLWLACVCSSPDFVAIEWTHTIEGGGVEPNKELRTGGGEGVEGEGEGPGPGTGEGRSAMAASGAPVTEAKEKTLSYRFIFLQFRGNSHV
jgi:hypothetical protein